MQASVSYLCWAVILQSHLINEMKEILGDAEADDSCLLRSRPVCPLSAHWLHTEALDAAVLAVPPPVSAPGAETVFLKCECAEAFMFVMKPHHIFL